MNQTHAGSIERKALIFNVQKYNMYDGPGIRTIVFSRAVRCAANGVPIRREWTGVFRSCLRNVPAWTAGHV